MKLIFIFILLFSITPSFAYDLYVNDDTFVKRINLNGYLGYRYMYSTLGDITPLHSGPEIGLVGTIDISDNFRVYSQFAYVNTDSALDIISYAFLEYANTINNEYRYSLQVGKIRREVGVHNKYRLNPSTRQNGIVVPQAIYWNQFETIFNTGYGIKVDIKLNNFKFGGSVTQPIGNNSQVMNVVLGGSGKHESKFGDGFSIWAEYNLTYNLLFKVTYNNTTVNDFLKHQHLLVTSLYYETDTWDISLETQLYRFNKHADFFGDFNKGLAKGIALVFNYDINENWAYNVSAEYHLAPRDLVTPVRIQNNFPKLVEYSWDFGIGGSYTYDNWQFRANFHYVKGGNFISGRDWGSGANFKDWAYMGASLVYHW